MISGPCTTILVFCAILSFCAWIILVCNEKGIHPLAGVTRLIHQPLGELLLLLVVVGGFVQYGATKGTNGNDRGQMALPSRYAPSITPVAIDSTGFSMPTNFPSVTNLCFWGIEKALDVVALGVAWPESSAFTNDTIDLFGNWNLTTNNWSHLAAVDVSGVLSNAIVEIDLEDMPTNMLASAFFRLAPQDDTDGDGISDAIEEWVIGTNPASGDSDGDGIEDGDEIAVGTNPLSLHSDGDSLDDGEELGWWGYGGSLPSFDVSGGEALLDPNDYYYGGSFRRQLPFPICCAGYVHNEITICVNGVVALVNSRHSSSFTVTASNQDYSTYLASHYDTVVAAYWDALAATRNSGAQITFADVTRNGHRFAVVEYSNMRLSAQWNNSSCIATFQVVIPQSEPNTVYVHYISVSSDFNGSGATIGAQLPERESVFPVAFNVPGAVQSGMVIAYRFGTGSDPLCEDSDNDGLDDGTEAEIGSSSRYEDTDDDGMTDWWEYVHGLNPVYATGDDGADGDPDNDHLVNIKEFEYGSHPQLPDTDNDGLDDGLETGYVFVTNAIPWLTFDTYVDLTSEIQAHNQKRTEIPTPAPVMIQGEVVTNITLYAEGMLLLNSAGYLRTGFSPSVIDTAAPIDRDALVIAPYDQYVRIRTDVPGRNTMIRYGTATYAEEGYLLFEFLNLYHDNHTYETNSISFQVAIPTNGYDRAFARYKDVVGEGMSGENAYIGMQTFGAFGLHPYCYNTSGKIWDGLCLEFRFGVITNPSNADTDCDGLLDGAEIAVGANPRQPDTDGDGMKDGWEWLNRNYGFDPLVDNATDANPYNDADADPDGDGLTNIEECDWNTSPVSQDSDGDGVADGIEATHGSDPADVSDGGVAYSRVEVPFLFGDPSGSSSEKYNLVVSPISGPGATPRAYSLVNAHYGVCETKTTMLKPGWSYEVSLFHAGTNGKGSGYPDYDYLLVCSASNVLIDDPDGLFGESNTGTYFEAEGKVATIHVLYPPKLVPDYDRDSEIDSDDLAARNGGTVFRFWINDDNDSGDINDSANDRPGSGSNGQDNVVNGRSDLIDFTPVLIDMSDVFQSDAVSALRNRITWKLESSAINAVWTSLSADDAGAFQKADCGAVFGPSLSQSVHAATVTNLSGGATLSAEFLSHMANSGEKGVILIEGRAAGTNLFLRGYLDNSQQPLLEGKLNINVSSVEDMYRWMNVRGASGESVQYPSRLDEPINMPDSETANRNLMFVHGANVSQSDSRGWSSEVFKRLWQSGMTAKLTAVSWRSNIGSSANYQENASNAFFTASILAPQVADLPGTKVLMAHSLGNVVCSSMIQDYGLQVSKYIMCNSAVPSEAYDSSLADTSPTNGLVHDEWTGYTNACWTALWYQQFVDGDARHKLTWRGRFSVVLPVAVNLYSTGDEVLEIYLNAHNPEWYNGFSPSGNWGDRYSWHKQELWKGRKSLLGFVGTTDWSGWGFKSNIIGVRVWSASEANAVVDLSTFATNTVFDPYPISITNAVATRLETDAHLAQGIPALSPPTGRTNMMSAGMVSFNINTTHYMANTWPRPNDGELGGRFLHSDIKNVAYFFVHPVFREIIEVGELNQ